MLHLLLVAALATIPGEVPVTTKAPEALKPFRDGREKVLNFQNVEAADLLKKAVALDPDFAQAVAYLGKVTPGAEGLRLAEHAVELAAKLGEPERLVVEILLSERKGEDEKSRNLKRRLADLAPKDWLAQFQLGVQSFYDHKSQATILYLNKAVQLNPNAAEAYNYLGYVLAQQGQFDEGIAACRKFVELKPGEPNAHDSLGEVLLLAAKYDEAEAAFRKAGQMSADNWMAWMGVAYAHFFRGDWNGGREEIDRAKKTIVRAPDRLAMDLTVAWSHLAEGQLEPALKRLDLVEKEATAKKAVFPLAWAAFERAEMLAESGKFEEAEQQLATARARGAGKLAGAEQNRLRRSGLLLQALIGQRTGNASSAQGALAQLQKELAGAPSNADLRGAVHFATGLVALAKGDAAQAVEALGRCLDSDYPCRLELAAAQEKAGDRALADETRAKLLRANVRDNLHRGEDPAYLFIRAKLKQSATAAAR